MIAPETERFERHVLILMALVQFINIWDFMIVMPLGPDYARLMYIDNGHLGWITGSYSISAAVVGIACARFLDRFDRRNVLFFNLAGLMLSTLAMVLANNLAQLITVRFITGMFGGTLMASSLAVIADVFPEQRRGEAVGKVFASFSIASVLGVPLGLEIAELAGWWSPFVVISAMALCTMIAVRVWLPPMRLHLEQSMSRISSLFNDLRNNAAVLPSLVMSATGLFATFLILPNISAHVQQNLHYPRAWLGLLYLVGGAAAFFSMRYTGRLSDRIGYSRTALYATFGLIIVLFAGFYLQVHAVPVLLLFVAFMVCMSTRNVTINALLTRIPAPHERAGFMSLNSAVQHLMAGVGAMCSTLLLAETPDGRLAGMDDVTLISIAGFVVSMALMFMSEKVLKERQSH